VIFVICFNEHVMYMYVYV